MSVDKKKAKELKEKVGLSMSYEECEEFVVECMIMGRKTLFY